MSTPAAAAAAIFLENCVFLRFAAFAIVRLFVGEGVDVIALVDSLDMIYEAK